MTPARPAGIAGRSRWLLVAALLAVAAAVRIAAMFYEALSGDDATVALIAAHVLRGEDVPAFFYRQTYMGSLNGIHLVPALFLFGPSVLVVRLNAVAWSLLFPLGLYVLGRRVFDERSARLALALAAVPPFLLTYWSTVAEPHFETNVFGVALLLLAVTALTASGARRVRVVGCLGFVAGLACWTSAKTVMVLGPVLVALLVSEPRLPLRPGGGLLAAGFALGSLPAWLYYATQPDPGGDNVGSAQRFLHVGLETSLAGLLDFLREVPPVLVGTYYWKPDTPLRRAALVASGAVYAAAVVAALAAAVRAPRRTARRWGLALLLMTLVAPFGALYGSEFGRSGGAERGRYVLPAYIPLLLLAGALIARIARRSRAAGAAVLAGLLAFNLWTTAAFLWPFRPDERARRAAEIAGREAVTRHLRTEGVRSLYVDGTFQSLVWQFLLPGVLVSATTNEVYVPSAVRVDAAPEPAALLVDRRHAGLRAQLEALGATWRTTSFPRWDVLQDVRVPGRRYRQLPRAGWRVVVPAGMPTAVSDGDLGTAWPGARLGSAAGAELVVDLGEPQPLARLVLWPSGRSDELVPLEIAGSLDATGWEPLGRAPVETSRAAFVAEGRPLFRPRNGWVELALASRRVRYLRVRPAEPGPVGAGRVAELLLYEAIGPGEGSPADGAALARRLADHGVRRLLTDPVVSARLALATAGAIATVPANGLLNNHGLSPPSYLHAPLRLRETDAALVAPEDAPELRARLASAGVRVAEEPLGAQTLFRVRGPVATAPRCRRVPWRVGARGPAPDPGSTRLVIEAALPGSARVRAVRVEHPRVSTRHAAVAGAATSDEGIAWRPVAGVRPTPEWAWAGRTLFTVSGGTTEIALGEGVSARHLRVELDLPYAGEDAVTALCARIE
jgi:4-amino-4-deoxy-L-arabinose transferase-like glycosyltransferase